MFHQYLLSMKRKYYQWRYWSNLYKEMKKEIKVQDNLEYKEQLPYISKPGIALSFDDSYRVNDWIKHGKDIFKYYGIKVTFNINGTHPLEDNREHTQEEIDKLLELQSDGHEIAHHGFLHHRASDYTNKLGYEQWIKDEIEKLLQWMSNQSHSKTNVRFNKPVSFAFPHFAFSEQHIDLIVPKYFKVTRGHLYKDHLTKFNHSGFAPSICLDGYYACNFYYLKKIIKLTKKSGKNLILTCHSILPDKTKDKFTIHDDKLAKWGEWRITPELLIRIITEAKKNDIEFYTTSEIAGIATFSDYQLESAVKEAIFKPKDNWVYISDLQEIKELDLSNRRIKNLDGLEYFTNLKKLNLANNSITDFSVLAKLKKLVEIDTSGNSGNNLAEKYKSTYLSIGLKLTPLFEQFSAIEYSCLEILL